MTKEGSTKMVNFITIGAGGLVLGRGYISHYSKYALSSTLSIYITLIAIVFRNIMLLSYATVDFNLFYDGTVDMQIWALLTRSQCIESLILRWPLRPLSLLLWIDICHCPLSPSSKYWARNCEFYDPHHKGLNLGVKVYGIGNYRGFCVKQTHILFWT